MTDAGFFRVSCREKSALQLMRILLQGTNSEQDSRFFNKTKKLMKSMKFPPNINTKVSS